MFDAASDPVLTASEVAEELPITREATVARLNRMCEAGLVDRKKTGARAVVWWAAVAPRLSEETKARVERSREQIERGETVSHDGMKHRLEMDGWLTRFPRSTTAIGPPSNSKTSKPRALSASSRSSMTSSGTPSTT